MQHETYEAPSLTVVGSIEQLTAGNKDGEGLDRDFPVGTKKKDLTFS